jgi:signal transduction histidine kinase
MTKLPGFKTRARLINQLGEQLIRNESIALLELIKNAYDADASECIVTMESPEDVENGVITILDDGSGMDYETLATAWLEVGTSYKDDLKNSGYKKSPVFGRTCLGEKGIGRLGVHRLGREIEIISRKERQKECRLYIDWDNISKTKYIEDLPVTIEERAPLVFRKSHGTKITIGRLRTPWTRKMARECARSITSLNSPFEEQGSFRALFSIENNKWLEGLLNFSDIKQSKLFSFHVTMVGDHISDFVYRFSPWATMGKLTPRMVTLKDIKGVARMVDSDGDEINLEKYKIGTVHFKGLIFDRDAKTLELGVSDKKGLKDYLDENGGIRVFKDNMRVLNYGEPGDDWLELDSRRVNEPTKHFSNNIVLGAVYLDHENSSDLTEKANREGFVDNQAYQALRAALSYAIARIESQRKIDKDLLRKHYGPKKADQPVISSIAEVKDVVDKHVSNESARKEIHRYLDRITKDYEYITTSLIKSAGAGLNLIVVIHQMQKVIRVITAALKKRVPFDQIEEQVKTLASLVEGYSVLVKKSDIRTRNLKGLIEQSVFNVRFRLDDHGIKLDPAFRKRIKNLDGICSESHVMNALMNLFDNSIWWLRYSRVKDPSIYVDICDDIPGFISVVVADNGPGFTLPTEEIVKPFVSDKPGGMGIGLHLTQQIMDSLKGKLVFPDSDDFDIPKKYETGATIALAFRKGE